MIACTLPGFDREVDPLEDFLLINGGAQAGNNESRFTHALDGTGLAGRKSRKLWTIFTSYGSLMSDARPVFRLDAGEDRRRAAEPRRGIGVRSRCGILRSLPNAIRQQLVILERDGLVIGKSVRRGKTKPTHEYSLTNRSRPLFPASVRPDAQCAVLREVRSLHGDAAVAQVFDGIAKRAVGKIAPALEAGKTVLERLETIADNIRSSGVAVEVENNGETIVLREHNCPYANVVSEHPECCTVIHTMLDETIAPPVVQTESLATGGAECRFEVAIGTSH